MDAGARGRGRRRRPCRERAAASEHANGECSMANRWERRRVAIAPAPAAPDIGRAQDVSDWPAAVGESVTTGSLTGRLPRGRGGGDAARWARPSLFDSQERLTTFLDGSSSPE